MLQFGKSNYQQKICNIRKRIEGTNNLSEKVIGVIPARYASSRLPGKPLAQIAGKSLIEWVWLRVRECKTIDELVVATDDERIMEACAKFGATAIMTNPDCPSGSDRIAEVIKTYPGFDIIVNVQGDEPLIDPTVVDKCVQSLLDNKDVDVSSAMIQFPSWESAVSPHANKVVTRSNGDAMYFSRSIIPSNARMTDSELAATPPPFKHLGLYVYRRKALEDFVQLSPSRYEIIEKLEQLRFLENGYKIRMIETLHDSIGVDTPEDIPIVEQLLKK